MVTKSFIKEKFTSRNDWNIPHKCFSEESNLQASKGNDPLKSISKIKWLKGLICIVRLPSVKCVSPVGNNKRKRGGKKHKRDFLAWVNYTERQTDKQVTRTPTVCELETRSESQPFSVPNSSLTTFMKINLSPSRWINDTAAWENSQHRLSDPDMGRLVDSSFNWKQKKWKREREKANQV